MGVEALQAESEIWNGRKRERREMSASFGDARRGRDVMVLYWLPHLMFSPFVLDWDLADGPALHKSSLGSSTRVQYPTFHGDHLVCGNMTLLCTGRRERQKLRGEKELVLANKEALLVHGRLF